MITEVANTVNLKRPKFTVDRELHKCIPHPLPRTNGFCWAITGRPGSGKSTLAFSTLIGTGEQRAYNKVFSNIFLVCPHSSLMSMQNNPFKDHPADKIYDELTLGAMEEIQERARETREEDNEFSLVIIDDCAADLKRHEIQESFKRMVLNRRHKHLSIIILSQSLNLIPLPIRKAFTHVTFFKFVNKKEYGNIFDELLQLDKERANEIIEYSFQEPHDHVTVDIVLGKFYRNFNELKFS